MKDRKIGRNRTIIQTILEGLSVGSAHSRLRRWYPQGRGGY